MFIDFNRDRKGEREKREKHECERETSIDTLLYVP